MPFAGTAKRQNMDAYPIKLPVPKYRVRADKTMYYPDYWVDRSVRIFGIHLWWRRMAFYRTRQTAEDKVKQLLANSNTKL